MDRAKTELIDKLKSANNVLVTVSRNPSVDQLSACIGLTLLLNKMGKHTAAVFSGQVPSTLEFLKPTETLEKTTDSLRDFIIALDKSKADKLRYKVEDNVVRIFITPYRTSISAADLEFSQGDFNVDVVIALGVQRQEDLDTAITAHGRILHDATVTSINASDTSGIGSINWVDKQASSLGELVAELSQTIGANLIDSQIATALLTGIVAETNRFSNNKTSPQTMSISAALMAAGANQQLVATKLEQSGNVTPKALSGTDASELVILNTSDAAKPIDHTQDINHDVKPVESVQSLEEQIPGLELPSVNSSDINENELSEASRMMTQAPTIDGMLNANTQLEGLDPSTDPLSSASSTGGPLLEHNSTPQVNDPSATGSSSYLQPRSGIDGYVPDIITPAFTPPPASWTAPDSTASAPNIAPTNTSGAQTLTDLEQSVNSPHVTGTEHLDSARDEVSRALAGSEPTPKPIQALNAQQLGEPLRTTTQEAPVVHDSTAPPPVPPPIPFQFKPPGA